MPDTAPGTITPESGWPGHWITVTRAEYHALIEAAGGPGALIVYSSCTRCDPDDYYVLTSWGREDQHYPLVQSVLEDCQPLPVAECPGKHTYQRFIYDPYRVTE